MNSWDYNSALPLWVRHPLRWLFGASDPALVRPAIKCPFCPNVDRNSIYGDVAWAGCQFKGNGDGADPDCVCDGYGTVLQQNRLGYAF